MFSVTVGDTRLRAGVPFLALLAALLTMDVTGTAVLCLLASFLHESGHILALLILGYPPQEITVGVCGIRLIPHSRPLGYTQQIGMLLAGPAVNLFLAWCLTALKTHPLAAAAHAVLGVFNLLPIEALDGGQVLRCFLLMRYDDRVAQRLVRAVSVLVLLPLSTVGFLLLIRNNNVTLAVVCGYLIARLFSHERI